jgi:hypothetical protein
MRTRAAPAGYLRLQQAPPRWGQRRSRFSFTRVWRERSRCYRRCRDVASSCQLECPVATDRCRTARSRSSASRALKNRGDGPSLWAVFFCKTRRPCGGARRRLYGSAHTLAPMARSEEAVCSAPRRTRGDRVRSHPRERFSGSIERSCLYLRTFSRRPSAVAVNVKVSLSSWPPGRPCCWMVKPLTSTVH